MESWSTVAVPTISIPKPLGQLHIYDTASGSLKAIPSKPCYRIYVCGITPYDATHLGHAATYLTFDLLMRYLRASGAEVRYVQNITDIDDPLLERAKRDGVDWTQLAESQINLFRSDMVALRVVPPSAYIGAVEAIPLVTQAIQTLESKESIYQLDSDYYFDISKDTKFGSRSHLDSQTMYNIFAERGGDPDRSGKRDRLDPLVWLAKRPGEPGWESPYGTGRPGWHIECSAIALNYLGPDPSDLDLIDIQGGGSDLIFPHHEMCASQVQVMTGKSFASAYVHTGMIGLDGEKMSKSKGNLVFVSQLLKDGVNPNAIRWALMSSHYRQDRMWTHELVTQAELCLTHLRNCIAKQDVAPTSGLIEDILNYLSNDLDTPSVLAGLNNWVSQCDAGHTGGDAKSLIIALDALLGLSF